jgi:hypothetical protein
MRLELIRSGGIANLRTRRSLDTASLSPDEGRRLEALLDETDIEGLERRSPIRGPGADRFQYDLRVAREGTERRVVISESEVPPSLSTVLEEVLSRGEDR